ncbi:hypothetical protein [Stenotrophomonas sp. PS02300]|uniref:hypothetical protein n=1 Tax=Stenotrophomonas sp. PS02300 TaxID=2991426 RepID=UPI00249A6C4A|nr:hypothetical protein [Stenotrophomonas sp. PS02300]
MYPIDAFKKVVAATAKPGSLLKIRDIWALAFKSNLPGQGQQLQILVLHGPNAGSVAAVPDGGAITVADPYKWMIYVDDLKGNAENASWPAVSFGAGAPVVHGHAWQRSAEGRDVTMDGNEINADGVHHYIPAFSVWLVDGSGRRSDTALLFEVSPPAVELH